MQYKASEKLKVAGYEACDMIYCMYEKSKLHPECD